MSKGCLIGLAAVLLIVLAFGGCAAGKYNGLVKQEEQVESAWVEIKNQYKRRGDLIPNLVETCKGVAEFEQETITAVTEARASVGRIQLPEGLPDDPAQLQQFIQAQEALGQSLGRLLLVSENYPTLKANQNFLSLQDQLEGTENRIAVARRDYINDVRDFNSTVRKFPDNLIAKMVGFEKKPQLEFEEGVEALPEVDFDFKKDG